MCKKFFFFPSPNVSIRVLESALNGASLKIEDLKSAKGMKELLSETTGFADWSLFDNPFCGYKYIVPQKTENDPLQPVQDYIFLFTLSTDMLILELAEAENKIKALEASHVSFPQCFSQIVSSLQF